MILLQGVYTLVLLLGPDHGTINTAPMRGVVRLLMLALSALNVAEHDNGYDNDSPPQPSLRPTHPTQPAPQPTLRPTPAPKRRLRCGLRRVRRGPERWSRWAIIVVIVAIIMLCHIQRRQSKQQQPDHSAHGGSVYSTMIRAKGAARGYRLLARA